MTKRRKPNVSLEQAKLLAGEYIAAQDLKGWRLEIVEAHRAGADPNNWSVIVDRFWEGGLVDGPQILIVNGATGEVRTFESYYE
ncbi:hypothetical protein [Sphingomonas psychrotolerans]|uniref:hypothetical protein n=1 Tax=Sphingomonas psychrotolerans TaxID=1327635 RepID=UPI001F1DACDF|nr:hypothetical protein [Sphingomonas psychrotolerans]